MMCYYTFSDTMIRLLKIKEIENMSNENGKSHLTPKTPAGIRLQNGIIIVYLKDLKLPKNCGISFPNGKDNIMHFHLTITPEDGFYGGGIIHFKLSVTNVYPFQPPKVRCVTKVCHPYIDFEGNVFLNILRNDWNPVFTITNLVDGIYRLFTATFTSYDTCFNNQV
ncbi:hypothetical protein LXL04_028609 [Taraxacum kok-saghyz]